jgi:hypothetical protein
VVIIYLSFDLGLSFCSNDQVPLPKFGFLACGVYPFHPEVSLRFVTVALSGDHHSFP